VRCFVALGGRCVRVGHSDMDFVFGNPSVCVHIYSGGVELHLLLSVGSEFHRGVLCVADVSLGAGLGVVVCSERSTGDVCDHILIALNNKSFVIPPCLQTGHANSM